MKEDDPPCELWAVFCFLCFVQVAIFDPDGKSFDVMRQENWIVEILLSVPPRRFSATELGLPPPGNQR